MIELKKYLKRVVELKKYLKIGVKSKLFERKLKFWEFIQKLKARKLFENWRFGN